MADLQVASTDQIRSRFKGQVIGPEDAEYDDARRIWNGMIDKRPVAVVRVAGVEDIQQGIALCREAHLPLAIRSGGHDVAGYATVDGGIVLDLGGLKDVEVDPAKRTIKTGPGATLGDLDRAAEPHKLVVPTGIISANTIGGLTLAGGYGWLIRAYGLTVDNLLEAEVVTAAGELVHASESEHPDLFWGLKGGGGNFGVVTSFTFRAQSLTSPILAGNLIYSVPKWGDALRAYAGWAATLDDRMSTIVRFLVPPPELRAGDRVLMLIGFAWAGADLNEGSLLLGPLVQAAPADFQLVRPTPWTEWQSSFDFAVPSGLREYWKNAFFSELSDDVIDMLVAAGSAQTWLGTGIDLHQLGGASGRVAEDATAFPTRAAGFWGNFYGFWRDPADDERNLRWIHETHSAASRLAMSGRFVNAMSPDSDSMRDQLKASLGPEKFERMVALKRKYDPENLFRLNYNIPPD